MRKLYEDLNRKVSDSSLSEEEKQKILKSILESKEQKVNVLITGATGCGKSSTINALFGTEKAKVGTTSNPETQAIDCYELSPNFTLWDSPGLGDGVEKDRQHAKGITKLLTEKDENGSLKIDAVLVILDGGSRDLGTSYQLINEVIAPCLHEDDHNRLIIGINQADMAMKGKHWDSEKHRPDETLQRFLKEKETSVSDRIFDGTGITVKPVSYSAGYMEEGQQEPPYNLSKLLLYIMNSIPAEKRLNVAAQINEDKTMWQSDDELEDYRNKINHSVGEGIVKSFKGAASGAAAGAAVGATIGSIIPGVGTAIGAAVGGVIGGVASLIGGFFDLF